MQTTEQTLDARAPVRAATPRGCSCSFCAISVSRPASSPATSSSSYADITAARRPARARARLHRPARLVRGLPAGRRLDRPRPDFGTARRRRTHPAVVHAGAGERRAGDRRGRRMRGRRSTTRCTCGACYESPRVTKPYTDAQWHVDRRDVGTASTSELRRLDVRLTMGGEPTFVSVDDRDGAEWNTAALGPDQAAARRRPALAAAPHFGAGRLRALRPGQVVSRRTAAALGARLLLAQRRRAGVAGRVALRRRAANYGFGARDAERFLRALAATLGVAGHARPARVRGRLVLPLARAPPAGERRSRSTRAWTTSSSASGCARVFTQGLDAVVGYALPLARRATSSGLAHGTVASARRAHVSDARRLADGLSPAARFAAVGQARSTIRTCASTIRWSDAAAAARVRVTSPRAAVAAAQPGCRRPDRAPARGESATLASSARRSAPKRATACCTCSCRRCRTLEDYLELVGGDRSHGRARLACPCCSKAIRRRPIRGCEQFQITPDPGVIEVNVQPAASWDELVEQTTTLYEEARQSRLTTEKFMLDGRHVGTGGGNHFVLGGATPADSPFLRRPDLLRSLVAYWHNHPSLSYLFSGLFIGPTSQAPRVDEARHDSVYELEIAFAQMPGRGSRRSPPWLVDRVFRHLLDRRHRQHAPRRVLHRQAVLARQRVRPPGLLEMRAFEMPPHARMSLAQQLLLRALVARFWREPYDDAPHALGHRAARPLHAAATSCGWTSRTCSRSCAGAGFADRARLVRAALRVPLPALRRRRGARHRADAAAGARAVARARRGRHGGRHGALRRFVGRAAAGAGDRA